MAQIGKRGQELKQEMEFYQGKNKPPAKLAEDVRNNEIDLNSQQGLLNAKKKDVDSINAKYDDDTNSPRIVSASEVPERESVAGE